MPPGELRGSLIDLGASENDVLYGHYASALSRIHALKAISSPIEIHRILTPRASGLGLYLAAQTRWEIDGRGERG